MPFFAPALAWAGGMALFEIGKSLLSPGRKLIRAAGNYAAPIEFPDVATIIALHQRGLLNDKQAYWATITQGVQYMGPPTGGAITPFTRLWQQYAKGSLSVPSPSEFVTAATMGIVSNKVAYEGIKRAGGSKHWWESVFDLHYKVPSPGEVMTALVNGRISAEEWRNLIVRSGADVGRWEKMSGAFASVVGPSLVTEVLNRGLITDATAVRLWGMNGYVGDESVRVLSELRKSIPGTGELLAMLGAGVFSPTVSSVLRLFDDQTTEYTAGMAARGFFAPTGYRITRDGFNAEATWADLLWGASRRKLSIGEALFALRRFRPSVIADYKEIVPDIEAFTRTHLDMIFETHAVPKTLRPWIEATAYIPLSMREMRTVVKLGIRKRAWLIERLQDIGHMPARAEDMADILYAQEAWRKDAPRRAVEDGLGRKVVAEVLEQYHTGTISRQQATVYLSAYHFTTEVIEQYLNIEDSKLHHEIAKAGIQATRRDYVNGTLSAAEALQQLQGMGIVPQRSQEYVALWTVQRSRVRRTASSSQILRWVASGLLDVPTALARLRNLGWDDPDTLIQLSEARGKLDQLYARRRAAADRERKAQGRALEKLQKDAERLQKQLMSDQRRATPRGVLSKWLCDGIITEAYFLYRMQLMGFPPDIAEGYLDDAKKKKACAPAAPGAPFPPETPKANGSGNPPHN